MDPEESPSLPTDASAEVHQMPEWVNKIPNEILMYITDNLDIIDIKSLLFTCRRFGLSVAPLLLRADIKTKNYDSLFWACSFNDDALAKACLRAGASPNVIFYHSDKSDPPRFNDDAHWMDFKDHDILVFPTRFKRNKWLAHEDYPCGPLILATKFNHLAVMAVLLGFWGDDASKPGQTAELVEMRDRAATNPRLFSGLRWVGRHSMSLSHVRTLDAAKLLLDAGRRLGDNRINERGNMGSSPLEIFLLRNASKKPKAKSKTRFYPAKKAQSRRLRNLLQFPEMERGDIKDIVKLFLDHGADPAKHLPASYINSVVSSPVLAVISTKRLDLMKLILERVPLGTDNVVGAAAWAVRAALRDEFGEDYTLRLDQENNEFSDQLLNLILDNGVSPNATIDGCRRLLPLAIRQKCRLGVRTLLERGANPNLADEACLSPLVWSMTNWPSPHFSDLIEFGANVNRRSVHAQGFTPLMFACGDAVSAKTFKALLHEGAERGDVGRLSPGGLDLSVLQCLLFGFPIARMPEDDMRFMRHEAAWYFRKPRNGKRASKSADEPYEPPSCQKAKFEAFVARSTKLDYFYTPDGRHVLNWAIDNLYENELIWAIKLLSPYYQATKKTEDNEHPLATFFSLARLQGYLRYGTLSGACEGLETMLEHDFGTMEGFNLESVIQGVCSLSTKMRKTRDDPEWSRVLDTCTADEHLKGRMLQSLRVDGGPPGNETFEWPYQSTQAFLFDGRNPLNEVMEGLRTRFERDRTMNVAKMIGMLLERGAPFQARSYDGERTAYEDAVANGAIEFIDEKWRDARLERQLNRHNSSANVVEETEVSMEPMDTFIFVTWSI